MPAKKDDLDINIDAFGNDSAGTANLSEDDLAHSKPLTIEDVTNVVRSVLSEMTGANPGARPNYPVHNPVGRPKQRVRGDSTRKAIGQYNILEYDGKDPNYLYRWVNDKDDGQRVQRFVDAGYVPVVKPNDKAAFDHRAGSDSQVGSSIIRSVGGGTKGVLMMIRKDWYEEDQQAKQERLDAIEHKMAAPYNPNNENVPNPETGMYGSVRINHG